MVRSVRRYWPLLLITLFFAGSPRVAFACSCAGVSKAQAARNVSAVFTGRDGGAGLRPSFSQRRSESAA